MSRSAIVRTRDRFVLEVLEEDRLLMASSPYGKKYADEASRLGMND